MSILVLSHPVGLDVFIFALKELVDVPGEQLTTFVLLVGIDFLLIIVEFRFCITVLIGHMIELNVWSVM